MLDAIDLVGERQASARNFEPFDFLIVLDQNLCEHRKGKRQVPISRAVG